jgi:hypothetical protein
VYSSAQQINTKAVKEVKTTIMSFANATEHRDLNKMEILLHDEYRVNILSREGYLNMLKEKNIGGEFREIEILSIDVNGQNAIAKVQFRSQQLELTNYFLLVQSKEGKWQIIDDLPTMKSKQ